MEQLITKYEAAERLSRSVRTITKWVKAHNLESEGSGRYARYKLSDLLRCKLQSEANQASGLFTAERRPETTGRAKSTLAYFDY